MDDMAVAMERDVEVNDMIGTVLLVKKALTIYLPKNDRLGIESNMMEMVKKEETNSLHSA